MVQLPFQVKVHRIYYNLTMNNHYNDPFGMDDDDEFGIGFGIRDDFDDPFDQMMGNFRFPNIGEIHQRIFGNFGRDFGGHIGDGNEGHNRHRDREGISQGSNMFQGFFCMQGTGPGTVISKSYCNKVDYRDGRPHQECYQSQSINQIQNFLFHIYSPLQSELINAILLRL